MTQELRERVNRGPLHGMPIVVKDHIDVAGATTPPTRNPWDLDRIPGASSGGSGAAVGAGLVPLALCVMASHGR